MQQPCTPGKGQEITPPLLEFDSIDLRKLNLCEPNLEWEFNFSGAIIRSEPNTPATCRRLGATPRAKRPAASNLTFRTPRYDLETSSNSNATSSSYWSTSNESSQTRGVDEESSSSTYPLDMENMSGCLVKEPVPQFVFDGSGRPVLSEPNSPATARSGRRKSKRDAMIRRSASVQSPRIPFLPKGVFDVNDDFCNHLEHMSLGDENTSISSPKYRSNLNVDGAADSETVWSAMSSLFAHASGSLDDKDT